jgi:hypothetical protein
MLEILIGMPTSLRPGKPCAQANPYLAATTAMRFQKHAKMSNIPLCLQ